MPRRGGPRQGTPGKTYQNRSDLNKVKPLPISAAPGQPYGEAGAQRAAQAQVPMANGDLSAPQFGDAQTAADQFNPPPVVPIGAPTMRPDEHVMTGVGQPLPSQDPSMPGSDPLLRGVALLNSLGEDASPDVKALRAAVAASQGNQAAP